MKKFSFELEKVLEFRNFEKEQAEGELAKALAVENEINNNLNTIARQYTAVKASMKGSSEFSDLIAQSQFYNLLNYQKEELLNNLPKQNLLPNKSVMSCANA